MESSHLAFGGESPTKCLIVGAGPVGALAALYAARRGWQVEVFELRGDLRDERTTPLNFTRSINLALSRRGVAAMEASGSPDLADAVLADTVPLHGRMIHGKDSSGAFRELSQKYDVHGGFLSAVDRTSLNRTLLDAVEPLPNVSLWFQHKLTGADFTQRKAWFEMRQAYDSQTRNTPPSSASTPLAQTRDREIEVEFDVILGCDGAHSATRFHLMKFVRMNYEQIYIDSLWCEFTIAPLGVNVATSPSASYNYATSPNHLHIWPGKDCMFIAIPSTDKTFTCTLFGPSTLFSNLEQDPGQIESFFDGNFPGAADLIGREKLRTQFQSNPHLPLVSIKCSPHVIGSTGVVLGDAAHAMVPFYGQGMNAGLEDVQVLFSHIDAHPDTPSGRAVALAEYNSQRVADAHTINDLALANYWEMRAGVRSRLYLIRKWVEEYLSDRFPCTGFATQYRRVSFTTERYSKIAEAVSRQSRFLLAAMGSAVLFPTVAICTWWTLSRPKTLFRARWTS